MAWRGIGSHGSGFREGKLEMGFEICDGIVKETDIRVVFETKYLAGKSLFPAISS